MLKALCPLDGAVVNLPITCCCEAGESVPDKSAVGQSTFLGRSFGNSLVACLCGAGWSVPDKSEGADWLAA